MLPPLMLTTLGPETKTPPPFAAPPGTLPWGAVVRDRGAYKGQTAARGDVDTAAFGRCSRGDVGFQRYGAERDAAALVLDMPPWLTPPPPISVRFSNVTVWFFFVMSNRRLPLPVSV